MSISRFSRLYSATAPHHGSSIAYRWKLLGTLGLLWLATSFHLSQSWAKPRLPRGVEISNINKAIDFIEKTGDAKLANRFREMLKDGKILVDPDDTAGTIVDGDKIVVGKMADPFPEFSLAVRGLHGDPLNFSSGWNLSSAENVMWLARRLVHEFTHIGQNYVWLQNIHGWTGFDNDAEIEAYHVAMFYMKKWIQWIHSDFKRERGELERYRHLRKLIKQIDDEKPIDPFDRQLLDWAGYPLWVYAAFNSYSLQSELDDNTKIQLKRFLKSLGQKMVNEGLFQQLTNKIDLMRIYIQNQRAYAGREGLADYEDDDHQTIDKLGTYFTDSRKLLEQNKQAVKSWKQWLTRDIAGLDSRIKDDTKKSVTTPPNGRNIFWTAGGITVGGSYLQGGPGTVAPGAKVTITTPDGKTATTTADQNGVFVFRGSELPEGFDPASTGNRIQQSSPTSSEKSQTVQIPQLRAKRPVVVSDLPMQTELGRHYKEIIGQLSKDGDLNALKKLREQIASDRDTIERILSKADLGGLGIEDLENRYFELDKLLKALDKLIANAEALKERFGKAGSGSPDRLAKANRGAALSEGTAHIVANLDDNPWTEWLNELTPSIAASVAEARRQQNAEGSSPVYIKGGAVLDAAVGKEVTQVTISITFENTQSVEPDVDQEAAKPHKTVVLKPDDDGTFQIEVPDGTFPRIRVAGPNNNSQPNDDDLLNQLGQATQQFWSEFKTLPEERKQQILEFLLQSAITDGAGFGIEIVDEEFLTGNPTKAQITQAVFDSLAMVAAQEKEALIPDTLLSNFEQMLEQNKKSQLHQQLYDRINQIITDDVVRYTEQQTQLRLVAPPNPDKITLGLDQSADDTEVREIVEELINHIREQTGAPDAKLAAPARKQSVGNKTSLMFVELEGIGAAAKPRLQQAVRQFADSNPDLKFAEAGQVVVAEKAPSDPFFSSRSTWQQNYDDQWALKRIGYNQSVFDRLERAEGAIAKTVVAVIGSGVDWTQPDLIGQMWINADEVTGNGVDDDGNGFVDDVFGWDFRASSNQIMDRGGHDTHVAGIIAARTNNGYGISGVNPHARLMALKVANYLGQTNTTEVCQAILYAVDNGARIINISYSGPEPSRAIQEAVDYAVRNDVLVVAASGNQATNALERCIAGNKGVLTVGGTTVDDQRALFSNYGASVEIAAPSMDVLSLRAKGTDFLLYVGENEEYESNSAVVGKDSFLYRASGTSFAAPFVSGAASLIRSMNTRLTAQQVQRMLLMTAEDLGSEGWDQFFGAGIVNLEKALGADPDFFLFAAIDKVRPVRVNKTLFVEVKGTARGNQLATRTLQIGFGERPADGDWIDVDQQSVGVDSAALARIPVSKFQRPGVWFIRLIVKDRNNNVRTARARLNLK